MGGIPFPDLSSLPQWQQILAIVIFFASAGIAVALIFAGKWFAKNKPFGNANNSNASSENVAVAAVIVDPAALNRLTGEVAGLTFLLTEFKNIVQGKTDTPLPFVRAIEKLADLIADYINLKSEEREDREKEAEYQRGLEAGRRETRRTPPKT